MHNDKSDALQEKNEKKNDRHRRENCANQTETRDAKNNAAMTVYQNTSQHKWSVENIAQNNYELYWAMCARKDSNNIFFTFSLIKSHVLLVSCLSKVFGPSVVDSRLCTFVYIGESLASRSYWTKSCPSIDHNLYMSPESLSLKATGVHTMFIDMWIRLTCRDLCRRWIRTSILS